MTAQASDKRWLVVAVLIFGSLGAVAGFRWLSAGSIEIQQGRTRVGVGAKLPPPGPQNEGPPAGRITRNNLLFYPFCIAWIGLGLTMVTLPILAFATSNEIFLRLSAFSCVAFLLLAFATVGAALWSGP